MESGLISDLWREVGKARLKHGDVKGSDQAWLNAHFTSPEFRDNRPFQDGRV